MNPSLFPLLSGAEHLHCLDLLEYIELTPTTALVGHGCWGDGGYGDFLNSHIMLNDWKVIEELKQWQRGPWRLRCVNRCGACERDIVNLKIGMEDLDRESIAEQLRLSGQRAADHIRQVLPRRIGGAAQCGAAHAHAALCPAIGAHQEQLGVVGSACRMQGRRRRD